jgi:hypothetical protein
VDSQLTMRVDDLEQAVGPVWNGGVIRRDESERGSGSMSERRVELRRDEHDLPAW